jgi:hypothetical protein
MNANRKINANTVFVFSVKIHIVNNQTPQIMRYRATAALYPTEVAPSAAFPVVEYEAAIPHEGVSRTPKDSQNTANMPMTIMEKKFPIIHSNIVARRRRTGPVK